MCTLLEPDLCRKIGENLTKNCKICRLLLKSTKIVSMFAKLSRSLEKSQKSGMVQRKNCRSRQELSDEYLLAKFGVDTAENEPPKGSKKCML